MTGAVSGLKQASESATQAGAASESTLGGTSGTVPGAIPATSPDPSSRPASHAPPGGLRRRPPYPVTGATTAPARGNDSPLSRYVRILETVAAARTGLTLTEIAQELGLQAGTVHRLLRGLVDLGLLRARTGSKSYVPGPRLRNLLHMSMDMVEYSGLAQSVLDRLVEEFGETAHLARLNGDCAESVLMKQPLGSDRAFVQPGRRLPLYAAASGKAILAFQDEDFIARYLAHPRVRYTERTQVDETEIRCEMTRIREEGMAVCENELDDGVLSYGHPVPSGDGHVLYSVGITGLADRFHLVARSRIRERLSEAAANLGRSFGFGGERRSGWRRSDITRDVPISGDAEAGQSRTDLVGDERNAIMNADLLP